jgi:poly-gamma-glutamate synthesis protein (capsule biosynthesis protein)
MIKINICGDFCVTEPFLNNNFFSEEIVSIFEEGDLNILNLECPVIDDDASLKIEKTGPHLRTNEGIFTLLKKINTHAVALANNHIMDYGTSGLNSTLSLCKDNNILTTGAGINLEEASQPAIFEKNGIKIGIINFCENEWSIATNDIPGANPLDLIAVYSKIKEIRPQVDFVIVIVHGGHEYYNYPSPRMVKQYRFFAENGADVVIGHHTHCISGYEIFNNVPIFYSLGNFLFTLDSEYKDWYTGLILQLSISDSKELSFSIHPIKQSKKDFGVSLSGDTEKQQIFKSIEEFSAVIVDEHLLKSKWDEFVASRREYYLDIFSPVNLLRSHKLQRLLSKLGLSRIFRGDKHYNHILNVIRCESHLDVSIDAIAKK